MKLTKKHIGMLFDVSGGDGSWMYQLVDIKRNKLLFYSFDGKYESEPNTHTDWRVWNHPKHGWVKRGWKMARFTK